MRLIIGLFILVSCVYTQDTTYLIVRSIYISMPDSSVIDTNFTDYDSLGRKILKRDGYFRNEYRYNDNDDMIYWSIYEVSGQDTNFSRVSTYEYEYDLYNRKSVVTHNYSAINGNKKEIVSYQYLDNEVLLTFDVTTPDTNIIYFTSFKFDMDSNVISETSYSGDSSYFEKTIKEYDKNGNLINAIHYEKLNGDSIFKYHRVYTYDSNGNKITFFEYDSLQNIKRSGKYYYNANNQKIIDTVFHGTVTTYSFYEYDINGNLIKQSYFYLDDPSRWHIHSYEYMAFVKPDISIENTPEIAKFGLSVFPNPFNPAVTISIPNTHTGKGLIQIYDIRGKMVFQRPDVNSQRTVWNASGMPNGIYLLKIRMGEKKYSRKLFMLK